MGNYKGAGCHGVMGSEEMTWRKVCAEVVCARAHAIHITITCSGLQNGGELQNSVF